MLSHSRKFKKRKTRRKQKRRSTRAATSNVNAGYERLCSLGQTCFAVEAVCHGHRWPLDASVAKAVPVAVMKLKSILQSTRIFRKNACNRYASGTGSYVIDSIPEKSENLPPASNGGFAVCTLFVHRTIWGWCVFARA
ncbi:MAG: hypothetical protein V4646_00390 [Pseudomonadota bacterium]